MKIRSSKYSCYIDLDLSKVEFDTDTKRYYLYGKDLIGNKYKVYISNKDVDNFRIEMIFKIHEVKDI